MPTRRLVIELDAGALPRGRVIDADGKARGFSGWVELAATLERARGVPPDTGGRSNFGGSQLGDPPGRE